MRAVRVIVVILITAGMGLAQNVAVRAATAMVTIRGTSANGSAASGTGVVVMANGTIVTNLHLVKGLSNPKIELANGDIFDSFNMVAADARRDLAIIRIPGFDLPYVALGNSNQVQPGDAVILVQGTKSESATVRAFVVGDGFRLIELSADPSATIGGGGIVLNGDGAVIGVLGYAGKAPVAIPINYARGLLGSAPEEVMATQPVAKEPPVAKKPTPPAPVIVETAPPSTPPSVRTAPEPIPAPPAHVAESVTAAPPAPAPQPKREPAIVNAAEKAPVATEPATRYVPRAAPVRKIYIEPIGAGEGPTLLHDDIVHSLEQSHFQVVDSREQADAVLSGTAKFSHVRVERYRARLVGASDDRELWSGELSTGGWIRAASGTIARALVKNIVRVVGEPGVQQ